MSFTLELTLTEYSDRYVVDCQSSLVNIKFAVVDDFEYRKILGYSFSATPRYNGLISYETYCDGASNVVMYFPYSSGIAMYDYPTGTDYDSIIVTLTLDGDEPPVKDFESSEYSEPYSDDCPFKYRFYKFYARIWFTDEEYYTWYRFLQILKGDTEVYRDTVDPENYDSEAYAMSIMQPMIDKCEKIPTTCCVLVCCEPDKYRLV